jgi:DME family drug/metabolite transporter
VRAAPRAVVDVLLAAVLFGTTGTAQALGPDGTTPLTVGAARLVVGAAGLVAVVLVLSGAGGGEERSGARQLVAALRSPAGLLAGLFVASYQVCFFAGVERAGVAAGTLVTLGSAPFLAGLLAWLVDHERPTGVWLLATAVAVAGLLLVSLGGATGGEADRRGLWLSLGAGASYACYTVLSKRLIGAGLGPTPVMAAVFSVGAVLLLPVLVVGPTGWLATPSGLALALYLGLVPTTLAYVLFGRGLAVLAPGTVATLNLAEPVVATLLGVVVLDEHLGADGAVGLVLVVAGLALLARASARLPAGTVQAGEFPA